MSAGAEPDDAAGILLVDDRPSNLAALTAVLDGRGYELVRARSGAEALSQVLRRDFAVILLDVAMPGMDGFEVASTIKEREQSKLIPIIFITASVFEMEHIFRGYTVGAVDYLRKPVDPHEVRAKVAVFVELYRKRKQIERQSAKLRDAEIREQHLLRERAEDALRESEALYELTFEEAPVAIGLADPDGRWTRGNRRLFGILGYEPADLFGRRVEELGHGDDAPALAARLTRLRDGEPLYRGEHRITTATGATIWAAVTLSALRRGADGALRRVLVCLDDISDRKRIELERGRLVRELEEGIRARNDFLSLAAHELKTPVTPLRLHTASLLRTSRDRSKGGVSIERLGPRLEKIDAAAQRLEALIDRLLDASRLSVGRLVLEVQDVDLAALVAEIAGRLKEQAQHAGCAIRVCARPGIVGRWDPLRVEQVAQNLLANAIKYGGGKPIEVRVDGDAEAARLSVRDHGVGIPDGAQERIFERFERLAPARHFGGLGLGLWIVREIVEAHSGRVEVKSQPGSGAEFVVELPLRPEIADGLALGPRGEGVTS